MALGCAGAAVGHFELLPRSERTSAFSLFKRKSRSRNHIGNGTIFYVYSEAMAAGLFRSSKIRELERSANAPIASSSAYCIS